jgi:hypothetical protein
VVLSTCIHTDELCMTRKTRNYTYPFHPQTVAKISSTILANKEIQIHVHIYVVECCFWVINTFCLVLQFVTVILSHHIATCNFTRVLFLPNFGVSCSMCITTTSLKLASSPYTVCLVIFHISAKRTPPWQEPSHKEKIRRMHPKSRLLQKKGRTIGAVVVRFLLLLLLLPLLHMLLILPLMLLSCPLAPQELLPHLAFLPILLLMPSLL